VQSAQADRKRRSDGDDDDRYDPSRGVDVGEITIQKKVSTQQRNQWDEDARAMTKGFRLEECRMAMETMRSCLQSQYDLAEIYSPPRVVTEAKGMGMKGGFSLDFSAPDPDGYIWDFSRHECRQKAFKLIRESRPYMIIGSPECTPFSTIQNLNMRTPEGKEKVEKAREEGEKHLEFCCKIYAMQIAAGRYFIHEHPLTATSWATDCMKKLRESPAVYTAEAHMCAYGMQSKDKHGPGYAKKPTRFLTNSVVSARALSRRCPENHRHVHLMEGRARAAAVYPQELCRVICRATLEQAKADAGDLVCLQCTDGDEHVDEVAFEEPQWKSYWDDLTGR